MRLTLENCGFLASVNLIIPHSLELAIRLNMTLLKVTRYCDCEDQEN